MKRGVPAELGVEGVGRHCSDCVLGVEDVDRMGDVLSAGELALDLLFEEEIEGEVLGGLFLSQYLSVGFLVDIPDCIGSAF